MEELRKEGFLAPEPETITELTGTITDMGENQLTLRPEQRYEDPLNEFLPETVIVKVSDQTEILRLEEKALEVLEQQEQEFEEKIRQYEEQNQEAPSDLVPPQFYTEEQIELSQLNKEIRLRSISRDNIKGNRNSKRKPFKRSHDRS